MSDCLHCDSALPDDALELTFDNGRTYHFCGCACVIRWAESLERMDPLPPAKLEAAIEWLWTDPDVLTEYCEPGPDCVMVSVHENGQPCQEQCWLRWLASRDDHSRGVES